MWLASPAEHGLSGTEGSELREVPFLVASVGSEAWFEVAARGGPESGIEEVCGHHSADVGPYPAI